MSEIDNLETLSNAELRGKIKEYGLQNIPVTDTSRNVIIKRLRASMGGDTTPAKKAGRRETIAAVERASPAKVAQASANRRTIAAAAAADPSNKDDTDGNKITSRRRSVNVAPATVLESQSIAESSVGLPVKERRRSVRDSPTTKVSGKSRRMSTIVLDSDDEDDVIAAAEKFEQQQQQNQRRSTSRAPSLTKSAVVVTAFNKNLETLTEENSSFMEMSQKQAAAEEENRQQIATAAAAAKKNYLQEQEMRKLQQQLREQELIKQRELLKQQQLKEQLKRQEMRQQEQQQLQQHLQLQQDKQKQQQLQQEQLLKHKQQQEELFKLKQQQQDREERIASFTRIYDEAVSSVSSQYTAQPLATSTMGSNIYPRLGTGYKPNRAALAMGIRSGVISGSVTAARTISSVNEFSDDTEAEEQKSDAEQIDSPFLSSFARNLKRLQAEPLRASPGGDLTRRFVRSRTAQEVTGRVALPRAYLGGRGQNKGYIQQFAFWDEKYHLARHFLLLMVLVGVFYISYKFWQ